MEDLFECSICHEVLSEEFMASIDEDGTDHVCNDCADVEEE